MNKYTHQIDLWPLEDYFFGGETTFGEASGASGKKYYAYSNPYPQQTSILGLLRYLLLESNSLLPVGNNKEEVNKLIGAQSFNPSQTKNPQDFGAIKALSPLFIAYENNLLRFAHELYDFQFDFQENKSAVLDKVQKQNVPFVHNLNPKNNIKGDIKLVNQDGKTISISQVFSSNHQIGIFKESTEEGFYKQEFYRLNKGFKFSFFADLNFQNQQSINSSIVFFGGEQKHFHVEVKPLGNLDLTQNFTKDKARRLILLSDAYVEEDLFQYCDFAITDTQDFRRSEELV